MSTSENEVGVKVVIATHDGRSDWHVTRTGLHGWFDVENGQFVLPFDTGENAVDVLRMMARSVARETDDGGGLE